MIVRQRSCELVAGGEVVNAKTGSYGETAGTELKGATRLTINAGDVVVVPAGTPHKLLIAPGTTYSALVAKVKADAAHRCGKVSTHFTPANQKAHCDDTP